MIPLKIFCICSPLLYYDVNTAILLHNVVLISDITTLHIIHSTSYASKRLMLLYFFAPDLLHDLQFFWCFLLNIFHSPVASYTGQSRLVVLLGHILHWCSYGGFLSLWERHRPILADSQSVTFSASGGSHLLCCWCSGCPDRLGISPVKCLVVAVFLPDLL